VAKKHRPYKVALKYCGSCNPRVDLSRIARHLKSVAAESGHFQLVPLSEDNINVVVILCGCPRACGNKEEVKARARPENELPSVVERELIKVLGSLD
jgi:hypothetical protein